MARGSVLLVDDDREFANVVAAGLESTGHDVDTANSLAEAIRHFECGSPDVAVLDIQLPDGDGLELLETLRQKDPSVAFVILSGYGTVGEAVKAIQRGAVDFVEKPIRIAKLSAVIDKAIAGRALRRQIERLRREVADLKGTDGILGRSPAIRSVLDELGQYAQSRDITVLLTGESGTGKELAARAVHDASSRADGPFIPVNCAAITESLLESELFGYEPGAFTGGREGGKEGLFEAADGGTLFLDEIGELDLSLQAKLLRVLQERRVRRVGGVSDHPIDIRVVASTNRDLKTEVAEGRFREDLCYRLDVAHVEMPPLRDRGDDVLLLAEHYLRHYALNQAKHIDGLSPGAVQMLLAFPWPGNVRELCNTMERAVLLCPGGEIQPAHLHLTRHSAASAATVAATAESLIHALPDRKIATLEKTLIGAVLELNDGNIAAAARELGIHRQTLYNKLNSYGLK